VRRLVAAAVGLTLLVLLWWKAEPRAIADALGTVDRGWFLAALLMVVPLTLASALRLCALARGRIGLAAAVRLLLSASSLNLVLPSKMGDLAKALVLRGRHGMEGGRAVALVVFEKLLDLMALLLAGALLLALAVPPVPGLALWVAGTAAAGLALLLLALPGGPAAAVLAAAVPRLPGGLGRRLESLALGWGDLLAWVWGRPGLALGILAGSLLLWAAHLLQLWMFARAIAADIPAAPAMGLAALAVLAGLLPFTFAGIGTRDAALVVLFAPWLAPAEGAVLGLFATLRYVLPALFGLPFVGDYWAGLRAAPRDAREGSLPPG